MSQTLLPSGHLLELFMPYMYDEARMLKVIKKAADLNYYRNFELGVYFDRNIRREVRKILEDNGLRASTFITPYVKDQHLSLCSLDEDERRRAVALTKKMAALSAETGYMTLGVPSGDDPGPAFRAIAKQALTDSLSEVAECCKEYGLFMSIEPLDRYAYKKQLIGPIAESVSWFSELHEAYPNTFIHWDSAHEALGRIDLMESLDIAAPYIGQAHLCNAITDESHPCFGDLHMEVGVAPDYETEGFLNVEVGAAILRRLASFDDAKGMGTTFVALEVHGNPGDDLWRKEAVVRAFVQACFKEAGLG